MIFHQYLRQAEPVYATLMELKKKVGKPIIVGDWHVSKGWKYSKGDEHFHYQRQRADTATGKAAASFQNDRPEVQPHSKDNRYHPTSG